ncbi:unnamed protein product [Heterotrigona itama]|uniref:CB1 cannabinoid receptor-interacting protein 1 n=1 Tax=Heterotrigona itama TaxID=395501 RepID=A0A6V7HEJ0_9HYME|nr:unnamed protein product [Heterotrigona itama]
MTTGSAIRARWCTIEAGNEIQNTLEYQPTEDANEFEARILSLSIGGKQVETIERARDGTACAYSAYHSTKGITASARGHREELSIAMRVFGSGYLTTCLQIKYYRQDDQSHCEWGARLHCIELDCSSVEGRLVTVDRETYRKLGIES